VQLVELLLVEMAGLLVIKEMTEIPAVTVPREEMESLVQRAHLVRMVRTVQQ
jgi:hypothetical protein